MVSLQAIMLIPNGKYNLDTFTLCCDNRPGFPEK